MGTHPGHRRRGLAAAVSEAALARAAERGAGTGVVYHAPDSGAERLYQDRLGFQVTGVNRRFTR